jgi:hypothetical protein
MFKATAKADWKLALWTMQQKNTTDDGLAEHYINHLDILSGTSVSCEQLFSVAKFILTPDTRKSMSPSVFESIPSLLKVNQTECYALSVHKSMGKTTGMRFGGDDAMQHAADNDNRVFYKFYKRQRMSHCASNVLILLVVCTAVNDLPHEKVVYYATKYSSIKL